MESATTNLAEVNADSVRLFNAAERRHEDVRELFVAQSNVTQPETVSIQVGDEVDTELVYQNPTGDQVPALDGLLQFIDQQYPGQPINKHYTIYKKYSFRREGDTHTTLLKRQVNKRTVRVNLDLFAPVLYQKRIVVNKITRPIYIFQDTR